MRSRDDHAGIRVQAAGQKGNAGCWHGAHKEGISTQRTHAGGERSLQHIARYTGIGADNDAGATGTIAANGNQGSANAQGGLRRYRLAIGHAANPVRAE